MSHLCLILFVYLLLLLSFNAKSLPSRSRSILREISSDNTVKANYAVDLNVTNFDNTVKANYAIGDYIFSIYVLDLEFKSAKDSDVQWLEPIIRMDRSCPWDMEKGEFNWEKDMYTWDLSDLSPTTMLIDNESLSLMKGKQRMNGATTQPFAAIVEGT